MKDELISFETAKLASEKGFDIKSDQWYRKLDNILFGRDTGKGGGSYPRKKDNTLYLAPTQSLLQRWLREKHNLIVTSYPYLFDGQITDDHMDDGTWSYATHGEAGTWLTDGCDFETYELALESGLFEALKTLN